MWPGGKDSRRKSASAAKARRRSRSSSRSRSRAMLRLPRAYARQTRPASSGPCAPPSRTPSAATDRHSRRAGAAGWLHGDHVRAQVGQDLAAEHPPLVGEVQHPVRFQHGLCPPWSAVYGRSRRERTDTAPAGGCLSDTVRFLSTRYRGPCNGRRRRGTVSLLARQETVGMRSKHLRRMVIALALALPLVVSASGVRRWIP